MSKIDLFNTILCDRCKEPLRKAGRDVRVRVVSAHPLKVVHRECYVLSPLEVRNSLKLLKGGKP